MERKRPATGRSFATTPRASLLMQILGTGAVAGPIALSRDEYQAVRRLYQFHPEGPNQKPPPPKPPRRKDFKSDQSYQSAIQDHERDLKAHANWQDPMPLFQAGADRNMIRHAELDGLRLVAWLAKFVPAGGDPLKTLVQLATDAKLDVEAADIEWAEDQE